MKRNIITGKILIQLLFMKSIRVGVTSNAFGFEEGIVRCILIRLVWKLLRLSL